MIVIPVSESTLGLMARGSHFARHSAICQWNSLTSAQELWAAHNNERRTWECVHNSLVADDIEPETACQVVVHHREKCQYIAQRFVEALTGIVEVASRVNWDTAWAETALNTDIWMEVKRESKPYYDGNESILVRELILYQRIFRQAVDADKILQRRLRNAEDVVNEANDEMRAGDTSKEVCDKKTEALATHQRLTERREKNPLAVVIHRTVISGYSKLFQQHGWRAT